jgi:hypothetical protein
MLEICPILSEVQILIQGIGAHERLLEGYGQDERITRLLNTCTYYIVPRINA